MEYSDSGSGIDHHHCSNCHCDSGSVIEESQRTQLQWNSEVLCDNDFFLWNLYDDLIYILFLLNRGQMSAVNITTKSNEAYELTKNPEEPTYM